MRSISELLRVLAKDPSVLLELQHAEAMTTPDKYKTHFFRAQSIKRYMEKYTAEKAAEYTLSYIYSACPKCGSENTEVVNFNEVWRDGDIVCRECKAYVRGYDAG